MTIDAGEMTKTQAAYSSIRRDIEAGVFPPGARLRVRELQTRLGFSPTPIREALRMLQSDGIVTNSPHQGMTVTSHEPEELEEVYRLREVIEPLAAEFAARRRTDEQIAHLISVHEGLGRAIDEGKDSLAAELNAQFHAAIVEASGSRLVDDMYSRLGVVLPLTGLWLRSRADLSYSEHETILKAIREGDSDAAAEAMRRHVDRGHRQATKRFGGKAGG